MMKPLTPEEREDFEISLSEKKHVHKFPKLMAWAAGITFSIIVWIYAINKWGALIIKYIVRP